MYVSMSCDVVMVVMAEGGVQEGQGKRWEREELEEERRGG